MEKDQAVEIRSKVLISFVVPAYNEEDNIPVLYQRVNQVDWAACGCDFELLIVDDHSSDGTTGILQHLSSTDARVKWLRFSRNFGSHCAFAAGLEHCLGNIAILLAADLQDPPEFGLELIKKWREGNDVVWACRAQREKESVTTRFCSRAYYWLMRRFAHIEVPPNGADFLLIDRKVMEALKSSPEKNTSVTTLIQWMGFRQAWIFYTKKARRSGKSKWTFSKKLKLAVDSLVSFSYTPIRLMSVMGFLLSVFGTMDACYLIYHCLVYGMQVEGWTSLICIVLILSGVQLLTLGVLGEYLWRAFDETRRRPRYIVESSSHRMATRMG